MVAITKENLKAVKKIMKPKYYVEMRKTGGYENSWHWVIQPTNGGIHISESHWYKNPAQCRNVGKRFAIASGYEWREPKNVRRRKHG